ncbi:UDP-N-acetylmuramate dehydrogenase [Mycetocola tolaasinivorans]|uniref:UDP-N-acetylenolpyruvoylglucosamine reductase n=1 Tax=Mycetocola tolaasinivorans TaxID=76635 RepID=A0A3L7A6I6_9MICO|nr:UDP-N-acetylmuramate dehydrogenase [Mycetocola tolaasinivorans]RLP75744.1 UDP-N-acetylmuramate dehydrogenase [Mycetocola tolaasinivorans]
MSARTLAELTTFQVGGPIAALYEPQTHDHLVETLRDLWSEGEEPLILGGGSNLVAGDDGYDGPVVRIAHTGLEVLPSTPGTVALRVSAGVVWDELVAHTVARGWSGLEALSGIPGSVGAAPIQNIGAYGQEVSAVLTAVELLDRYGEDPVWVPADQLELGYRTSVLKRHQGDPAERDAVVLTVEFALTDAAGLSAPIAYGQLAGALGTELGAQLPVAEVRASVLALRASKGMVHDPRDRDTFSAGSFFTNPIVPLSAARSLPADAPRWPVDPIEPEPTVIDLDHYTGELPGFTPPARVEMVKLSAAWLIEHAGVGKGFHLPGSRAAISSKHTLALTNTGGSTGAEVAALARFVQARVAAEFGVHLAPEPVLVGVEI